jgi:hypothetical protein
MALLEAVDLDQFADTMTAEMPYGRKRALEIATTLALEPDMMLLDEPTQGMGHEDIARVVDADPQGVGQPHHPDGRAQPVGGRQPVRPDHRADARQRAGRGDLRRSLEESAGAGGLRRVRRHERRAPLIRETTMTSAFKPQPEYPAPDRPARLLRRVAHPARHRSSVSPRANASPCWAATARAGRPR